MPPAGPGSPSSHTPSPKGDRRESAAGGGARQQQQNAGLGAVKSGPRESSAGPSPAPPPRSYTPPLKPPPNMSSPKPIGHHLSTTPSGASGASGTLSAVHSSNNLSAMHSQFSGPTPASMSTTPMGPSPVPSLTPPLPPGPKPMHPMSLPGEGAAGHARAEGEECRRSSGGKGDGIVYGHRCVGLIGLLVRMRAVRITWVHSSREQKDAIPISCLL